MPVGAIHPLVHLLADPAQPVDAVVGLRNLVADLDQELELGVQIFLAGPHTGVLDDAKDLRLGVVPHLQHHLVLAGRRQGADNGVLGGLVLGHFAGGRVAQVPHEAVHTRLSRDSGFAGIRAGFRCLAGEALDDLPGSVPDGEGHVLGRLLQVVVDHCPVGWVLPGIPHLPHGLAGFAQRLAVGHVRTQTGPVDLAGAGLPVTEGRPDP